MSFRLLGLASVLCVFASFSAHASRFDDPVLSDTVATADLNASFYVVQVNGGAQAEISIDLEQIGSDADGNPTYTELTLSPDETVLISQGSTTVQYDPSVSAQDVLPYVDSGTYSMTFIRFNGETYTSTVTMPSTVAIAAPADQSVFDRSQEVDVSWNAVQADMNIGMLMTVGCGDVQGDVTWNDTSAVVPAGYAAAADCTGLEIDNYFVTAYATGGTTMEGLQGGFSAETESEIEFIYPGPAPSSSKLASFHPAQAVVQRKLARAVAQARREGKRVLHVID